MSECWLVLAAVIMAAADLAPICLDAAFSCVGAMYLVATIWVVGDVDVYFASAVVIIAAAFALC